MVFNFHGLYTNGDKNRFRQAQEEDLLKICDYLETEKSKLADIRFEVFDTREGKQSADPHHSISRASARFNEMALYRVWIPEDDSHFPHEITHLIAHTWTKPYFLTKELDTAYGTKVEKTFEMVSTSFMQEGLAIAVDDIVFQRKLLEEGESKFIDDWCREQLAKMPSTLKQVINLEGFGSIENKIVVPFAASVSKYLLHKFGVGQYKKMYIRLVETNFPSENIRIIEEIYQLSEKQILVHSAGIQDTNGAKQLVQKLAMKYINLKKLFADGGYKEKFIDWARLTHDLEIEVVKRNEQHKFVVLPKRWVVERTFSWLLRNRRLAKDYERLKQSAENMVYIAMTRLMLKRLAFTYS